MGETDGRLGSAKLHHIAERYMYLAEAADATRDRPEAARAYAIAAEAEFAALAELCRRAPDRTRTRMIVAESAAACWQKAQARGWGKRRTAQP